MLRSAGDQPVFRFGEVVNVKDDRYRMGRVQVRVIGMTDDKRGIPDEDLPWYTTLQPTTSSSLAGVGTTSGLEVGSKVLVLMMDYPQCQHGIVIGSHYPGPSSPSHLSPLFKGTQENGPPAPIGPDGKGINLGMFGDVGITDVLNNVAGSFQKLLENSIIFNLINVFKSVVGK
jgi:hypothetical protein